MSKPTIGDEMVEAFIAIQTARIDGTERVRAGLAAVFPLIRAQVAAEHRCVTVVEEGPPEFFIDDHDMAAIGVFEPDEPVADVVAAFEAGEKGATKRPTTEGQERSEEKPGPGETARCPTCSRDIGVGRHGRLTSHYKPGTLARCEGDGRG